MTPAEAKRRSREKMRAEGAKDYLLTVGQHHLVWIKHLAEQQGISEAAALRVVLDNALDYFCSFSASLAAMKVAGASPEECDSFVKTYWPLPPPKMPEILVKAIEAAE
jgi:hypothetical protein